MYFHEETAEIQTVASLVKTEKYTGVFNCFDLPNVCIYRNDQPQDECEFEVWTCNQVIQRVC